MPCLFAESGIMTSNLFSNSVRKINQLLENQAVRYANVSETAKSLRVWIWPILIATILYLPICMTLKAFYKNRKPFPYRNPVVLWNLALSVLSGLGSLICLFYQPKIFLGKADPAFEYTSGVDGSVGVHPYVAIVVRLFCITKVIEYGDTFWLCVKKRPTIFLHLYHHITVSLYCLHAVLLDCPFGHFFAFVNLNVHAVMYGYYAAAIVFKGNKTLAAMRPFITLGQLTQMFFGTAICTYELISDNKSFGLEINAFLGFVMYVSYAYLFGDFFIGNYKKNLSSVDTLFALTPLFFFPLVCFIVGWNEMLYNPWSTFLACGISAALFSLTGMSPMSVVSPIYYSGIEAKAYGVKANAVRCFSKRVGVSDESSTRICVVALRYALLPIISITIDSILTTHVTLRSVPLIFLAWIVHAYAGSAFEMQKVERKDEEAKPASVAGESLCDPKMVETIVESEPEALRLRSTYRVVQ